MKLLNKLIYVNNVIMQILTSFKILKIFTCLVETKNIPENEIWAGNPAKFVKKVLF